MPESGFWFFELNVTTLVKLGYGIGDAAAYGVDVVANGLNVGA